MHIWRNKNIPWHWVALRAGKFALCWQCAIHGPRIQYIHTPVFFWRKNNCGVHFGVAFGRYHAGVEIHW